MASQEQKRSGPYTIKQLSTINLGGNIIRYIGMNYSDKTAFFPKDVNECTGRLLFVGSDVLLGTSVHRKNSVRHHVRFGKENLATKMRLTGFKIAGMNSGEVVWFYSIQGLFHVAFELGTVAFQRDCVTKLKDEWLGSLSDPFLPMEDFLMYDRAIHQNEVPNVESVASHYQSPLERTISNILNESSQVYDKDSLEEVMDYVVVETSDGSQGRGQKALMLQQRTFSAHSKNVDDLPNQSDQGESCDSIEHNETDQHDDIEQLVQTDILRYLKTFYSDEISYQFTRYILVTIHFLKKTVLVESGHKNLLPFYLMDKYLEIVNSGSDLNNADCFGVKKEEFIMLCVASTWLGKKFHKFEEEISQRVLDFKKENITCIDSLPSSEKLIDILFPSCMKTFIISWLGLAEDNEVLQSETDHNYSATSVLPAASNSHINFPLVQLILEFCSNCLISGIAHVVFSRLKAQNDVENKVSN